jgi:Glycosyltransferase family 87
MFALGVDFRRLLRRAAVILFTLAAIGSGLLLLTGVFRQHHPFLYDFKGGLYDAGTAIVHGHSPYRPGFLAQQAAVKRAGGIAIGQTTQHSFSIPLYPAPANVAIVPLGVLPFWLAAALFTCASLVAMIAGLWLLRVRDWRCFALALLSWPFVYSIDLGALGPLLLLGIALIWRWRNRVIPPSVALATIVAVKIFPWTLGLWLLITKRYRALAASVAIAIGVTIIAWALIGFAGMAQYPQMLANATFIQEGRAASLVAVLIALGLGSSFAQFVSVAVALLIVACAWRIVSRPRGESAAFGLVVIAALTASPIVWDHYLVLLFVPIALMSPRLSPMWLLPGVAPLLYAISVVVAPIGPRASSDVRTAIVWLIIEGVVACWLLANVSSRRRSAVTDDRGLPRSAQRELQRLAATGRGIATV